MPDPHVPAEEVPLTATPMTEPELPVHTGIRRIFTGSEGLRAGWSILLFLAIFAGMLFAATAFLHRLHPAPAVRPSNPHREISPRASIAGEGVPFLLVMGATWIMGRIERRAPAVYGFGGTRKLSNFVTGLAWGVALLSLLVFALKFTGLLIFEQRLLSGPAVVRDGAIWLLGFLLVGCFEESLTRGFLQFTLARGLTALYRLANTPHSLSLGFWTAALLLSLLFGLGHGSNPGESPLGLVSAGLAALVFCLSLWRTGSLWWAIGFHATWDWAQSFLYGVADSGTMVQFHLFATHPAGRPLLSGGTTGPEGSLFVLPVLSFAAVVILLTLPATPREQRQALDAPGG